MKAKDRKDRVEMVLAQAVKLSDCDAASELAPARGSVARVPTIVEMREALKDAGWIEKYSTVWMTPDGRHYRGPALAWHMMMGKPWPPNNS